MTEDPVRTGLPVARDLADRYVGVVRFADPRSLPGVDVHAEKGSGLRTIVGARLADLEVGQVADTATFLDRDGDGHHAKAEHRDQGEVEDRAAGSA